MTSEAEAPARATRGSSGRRDEIVRIAAEMFAERGFNGTTIRDIGQRADILSGSLYHHFRSKESIADEIVSAYWRDLLELVEAVVDSPADAPARLRELVTASSVVFERHEAGVRMLLNDWTYLNEFLPYIKDNMVRLEEVWTSVLEQGVLEGTIRADLNPSLMYRTIMSSISGMCRWYKPGGAIPIQEIFETMVALYLTGAQV